MQQHKYVEIENRGDGSPQESKRLPALMSILTWIILASIMILACAYIRMKFWARSIRYDFPEKLDYGRFLLRLGRDTKYLRVDSSKDTLRAESATIWIMGNHFELSQVGENSWRVRSALNGKLVYVDSSGELRTGIVSAGSVHLELSFVRIEERGTARNGKAMMMTSNVPVHQATISPAVTRTFVLEEIIPIHGVNLGSWFIPERWISATVYEGVVPYWSQVCGLVHEMGQTIADRRMEHHIKSFVTEKDFDMFASTGINSIRIPIGYWNVIDDPYNKFAPSNVSFSLHYVDWAMTQARKRGLSVLLDLHGMPGSQNGWDHSGCGYNSVHGEGWNTEAHRNISLLAVEAVAQRYGHWDNLLGIEVLNEPAELLERNHHADLKDYYVKSYKIIRSYSDSVLVVFSVLFDSYYGLWTDEMQEPEYYNVVMDW